MESIWNANIPWNPHGFHVEYVWFHMEYKIESIWNRNIPWIPHGFHMEWKYSMDSTWNGHVFIPCGFQVDSIWNPYGMRDLVEFGNKKKCLHLFYIYNSLQKW
jgi:hypothetical protein